MEKVHDSDTETNHAESNGKAGSNGMAELNGKHNPAGARKTPNPQAKTNGMVNGNVQTAKYAATAATAAASASGDDVKDLDGKDQLHWQHMYDFRVNVLGFPEELARERCDRMIETLREIRAGKYRSYYRRDVPAELTIASRPPTADERRRWELLVKNRIKFGGLSLEAADESARTTIEKSRLLATHRKPRIKAVK